MKDSFVVYSWEDIVSNKFPCKEELKKLGYNGTALSVGGFDGVHLGHQELLRRVLGKKNLLPGVVTFSNLPASLKNPTIFNGSVCTLQQKIDFFKGMGFCFVVVIDFSYEFSKMDGNKFLSILKDSLSMSFMAEGIDFRCGYKGSFDIDKTAQFLTDNNIMLEKIAPVIIDEERISSSLIRSAILLGDFSKVGRFLGRPYSIDCTDIKWNKMHDGNIICTDDTKFMQVLPKNGVYNVSVVFNDSKQSKLETTLKVVSGKIKIKLMQDDLCFANGLKTVNFTV